MWYLTRWLDMWNILSTLPLIYPIESMSIPASEVPLRESKLQARYRAIVLLGLIPLAGCIAHAPGSGGGGQQKQILVTVSPSPQSVAVGAKQQFTASLLNTSNQNVSWSLALGPNSTSPATSSELGSIDANGMYTAPPTVPACAGGVSPCEIQVAVTATSQADSTASGQALANVHITISISPTTATMGQGANLLLTDTVTGTPTGTTYQSVNWQPVCTACATGQGGGSIDPNNITINTALYIAPPLEQGVTAPQTVSITVTSSFDPNQFATAMVTVDQTDPLGTATPSTASGAAFTCPTFADGLSGATCYKVETTCDQVADFSAYLKVNTPAGTPLGTVIFGTGAGGGNLYDDSPDFFYIDTGGVNTNGGLAVVKGVFDAGYTTVQVSFGAPFDNTAAVANGWLQGPGGVRRLACRYATVAEWIYQNIHLASTSAPFCATGNSGGAGAIGYALSEYGMNTKFNMVEMTSGPVMTRLDAGCSPKGNFNYNGTTACTNPPTDLSYSPGPSGTASIIDTAYQSVGATTPTLCSDGVNGTNSNNFLRFESDSIDFSPSKSPALPISGTSINVLFGGNDNSNAVPQGEWWWKSVAPPPTQACVADAPHAIPAATSGDGATHIISDITSRCVLP
jgi:hypothetical protein